MNDNHFHLRLGWGVPSPHLDSGDEVQYLLRAEHQLLQSISGRAPIADVLHKICQALDSQLGNMFSVISLPTHDPATVNAIAKSATRFRLYKFVSATVVGDNDQSLASLEMYCTLDRRPHLSEVQLIERATCLAAVAIQRHNQSTDTLVSELPSPSQTSQP
jgi:hypothetical protein